ncbi:hypothetical protein Nepgr_016932 [Nepenthes gracilis]|uniref:Uncharacterized protein n=1 Tax=Nepenthes gracilis TaxID=150966 RepID=A0AAD3XST9_NEPGR|nr:hypothetical protein Nepgr_016932 [Nepenthes gracilis]
MRLERREEPKRRKLKMRGRLRINKRKSDCANPGSAIKKSIQYPLHSLAPYCVVSSGPSTSSTSKSVAYQFPSPQSSGHAPQSQFHSPNLSNWHRHHNLLQSKISLSTNLWAQTL